VSFPPETKVCLHCGNRLGRGIAASRVLGVGAGGEPIEVEPEDLEEGRPRGLLKRLLGSSWILLVLTATCYRVCTG
jgi:hypothetical protein